MLGGRFEAGRDAVAAGVVRPHGQPAGLFTPELISAELAGVAVEDELTGGQCELARAAIRGRRDSELAELLAGLPPRAAGAGGLVAEAGARGGGLGGRALAYLSGDPAPSVAAGELGDLVVALVTGLASAAGAGAGAGLAPGRGR